MPFGVKRKSRFIGEPNKHETTKVTKNTKDHLILLS